MDAGYTSAELVLTCAQADLTLLGPVLLDTSPQARANTGFDRAAFHIDFDTRQVTCPQGVTSASWAQCRQRGQGAIVVKVPADACRACPVRDQCTRAAGRYGRQRTLHHRDVHQALQDARAQQSTNEWKARYASRAGVEGTIHQAVAATRGPPHPLPRPAQDPPGTLLRRCHRPQPDPPGRLVDRHTHRPALPISPRMAASSPWCCSRRWAAWLRAVVMACSNRSVCS
ncbi:MAG TPA: transposase [Actinomycetes bacterium]|nr:transposase [Actinomycetes bacterium]